MKDRRIKLKIRCMIEYGKEEKFDKRTVFRPTIFKKIDEII
jgi:hypothetical protein